ncbi:PadR family transcriptional regulator [Dehalococcoides sp. THU3]|jgi:DNA-binding PadR family transcriptional regulator|uniref:PadR family transcriptional regulator n=1 Tax=Dehalococcoides TaxID=61434 RepID=UPI00059E9945|nr:PadR family transcriptional regulator [Dehalococcoides mccartyi]
MDQHNNMEKARKRYIPMSETMLYILFSLKQELHGYAIMQHVKALTKGRIILGAGTIYSSLGKLESDNLIQSVREEERRKIYIITPLGSEILHEETARITELYNNVKE